MPSSDEENRVQSKPLKKEVPKRKTRTYSVRKVNTSSKCFIGTVIAFALVVIIALVLGLTLGLSHTEETLVTPPPLDWYQNGTIYRIYIPSFGDSDGNGIGDFAGIEEHLNYLKEMGVTILWLSPIQETNTFGYDVSNFVKIKDDYGNSEKFKSLLTLAESMGMKVIMDIIINHSSRAHEWFKKSRDNDVTYRDYYVWSPGQKEDMDPPNNWVSIYNKTAWSYAQERGEYFLHQFRSNEPDLNYRSPQVVSEMKRVVGFWLDQGVDGFYIRDLPFLFEDRDLRDETPLSQNSYSGASPDDYVSYRHENTRDLSESYQIIQDVFVSTISPYNKQQQIVLMADLTEKMASDDKWVQMYQLVTSNSLYNLESKFNGRQLKDAVQQQLQICNKTQVWPAWTLGNEETSRINNKFGRMAPGLQIVQLLLPGIKSIYYGEEIEMSNLPSISFDDTRDPVAKDLGASNFSRFSRDPFRTPMLWNSSRYSGFTTASKPWLPMTGGNTADSQQKKSSSLWNSIVALNKLKNSSIALSHGSIDFPHVDDNIFSFSRIHAGDPIGYLIVWNVGPRMEKVPLDGITYLPDDLTVIRKIRYDSSVIESTVVKKKDLSVEREELWVITFQKRK